MKVNNKSSVRFKYHIAQFLVLVVLCVLLLFVSQFITSSSPSSSSSLLRSFIMTRRQQNNNNRRVVVATRTQSTTTLFDLDTVMNNNCSCAAVEEEESTGIVWNFLTFVKLGASICLIGLSGLFSGLTLGLLGLDKTTLDIIKESGKEKHRVWAARIIPIRKRGNLLLCTLLLGNVMVNTGISVLTTDLTSGIAGFIISSAAITLFGEIIPQATCSRYALAIGAHTFWLVYIFMFLLLPLTFPLAFILDKALGKEMGTVFTKEELKKLVEMHVRSEYKTATDLVEEEAKILGGVLDFAKKTVENVMTRIDTCFMLEISDKLDVNTMTKIWQSGHSRIPIYKGTRDDIVGILFAKDLVLINPEEGVPLSTVLTFYGREVIKVFPDTHLDEMLKTFKTGRSHLAVVHDVHTPPFGDPVYVTVGLVSLEDVIEEILKDEIVDETDIYIDNQSKETVQRVGNGRIEITLFSGRAKGHRLTPKQVIAVASYLEKTLEVFRCIPDDYLHQLLGKCTVFEIEDKKPNDEIFIYEKGKPADYFALILNGRIEVLSGEDNFSSEQGLWSYLGIKALTAEREYIPDFSARVVKSALVLKISKHDYAEMVCRVYKADQHLYLPDDIRWIVSNSVYMSSTSSSSVVVDTPPSTPQQPFSKLVESSRLRGMSQVALQQDSSEIVKSSEEENNPTTVVDEEVKFYQRSKDLKHSLLHDEE